MELRIGFTMHYFTIDTRIYKLLDYYFDAVDLFIASNPNLLEKHFFCQNSRQKTCRFLGKNVSGWFIKNPNYICI